MASIRRHADLTPDQRPLYDDMKTGTETNFKGFKAIDQDGRLIGPWNPWSQGLVVGTQPSKTGPRNRHPCHRRQIQIGL